MDWAKIAARRDENYSRAAILRPAVVTQFVYEKVAFKHKFGFM